VKGREVRKPSKVGTVPVTLTREQAGTFADFLAKYQPSGDATPVAPMFAKSPAHRSPWNPEEWAARQRLLAAVSEEKLRKAAERKRPVDAFEIRFPRHVAEWLASFVDPKGWWPTSDGLSIPAQFAPEKVRAVAKLFLSAVSGRRSTPPRKALIQRMKSATDPSYRRRLKKTLQTIPNPKEGKG